MRITVLWDSLQSEKAWVIGCFVPTAEVGVPETLKVDGSFCSDAHKTMQIFLGNVF